MGETMAALLYVSLVGSGRPSERATESRTRVGRQHVSSLYSWTDMISVADGCIDHGTFKWWIRNIFLVFLSIGFNEQELKQSRDAYESSAKQYGEGNLDTIRNGLRLAMVLQKGSLSDQREAGRFMTTLAATCKRVHGRDHRITKEVVSQLRDRRVTGMLIFMIKVYVAAAAAIILFVSGNNL